MRFIGSLGLPLMVLLPGLAVQAQVSSPSPNVTFPKFVPGTEIIVPLKDVPAEEKKFMEGSSPLDAVVKKSPKGQSFRLAEATNSEVRDAFQLSRSPDRLKKATVELPAFSMARKSDLAKLKIRGMIADSPSGRGITRVLHVFENGERILYLREFDMAQEGAGVIQFSDYLTGTVRGSPAVLVARRSSEAGTFWALDWTSGTIDYELGLYEPTFNAATADELFQMAESIPLR